MAPRLYLLEILSKVCKILSCLKRKKKEPWEFDANINMALTHHVLICRKAINRNKAHSAAGTGNVLPNFLLTSHDFNQFHEAPAMVTHKKHPGAVSPSRMFKECFCKREKESLKSVLTYFVLCYTLVQSMHQSSAKRCL